MASSLLARRPGQKAPLFRVLPVRVSLAIVVLPWWTMDQHNDAAEFLRSRRDRISPERAGIVGGSRRRVPGLRREEVAMLANVSVDYYAKLERGDLGGASPEVLDSVARALQLDEAETDHLLDLARAAGPAPLRRRRPASPAVDRGVRRLVESVTEVPLWMRDRRMDLVVANGLGRALYAPVIDDPAARGNTARFTFLSPAARTFFPEWEQNADGIVATMRSYAGQAPHDKGLTDVIGELVTRSDDFRVRWAAHDVRHHRAGAKRICHPQVGDLELTYVAMDLPAHPEWFMFAYTAEAGSASQERLALLGSLAATPRAVPGAGALPGRPSSAPR